MRPDLTTQHRHSASSSAIRHDGRNEPFDGLSFSAAPAGSFVAMLALAVLAIALGRQVAAQPPVIELNAEKRNQGYLGLTADNNPDGRGVKVLEVVADSPAKRVGIQSGDIILAIDDRILRDVDAMIAIMKTLQAGDKIKVDALRQGRLMRFEFPLAQLPRASDPAQDGGKQPLPARDYARELLGVELRDVPATSRTPAKVVVQGVVVIPGKQPKLPLGASIREIARTPVRTVADCQRILSRMRPGERVDVTYVVDNLIRRTPVLLGNEVADAPAPAPGDRTLGGTGPLESRLGESGRRPILGRLGRVLDGALEDAIDRPGDSPTAGQPGPGRFLPEPQPAKPPVPEQAPVPERAERPLTSQDELAQEVRELRVLVEALLERIEELEKKQPRQ